MYIGFVLRRNKKHGRVTELCYNPAQMDELEHPERKRETLMVRLTPRQKSKLEALSRKTGIAMGEIIRQAIERMIDRMNRNESGKDSGRAKPE